MVRGVRKVAREPPGRAGMAFLAGGDYIAPAQMRVGIGHGKNIMRAVAVIALCGFIVAQLRNLSVIGFKIGFCNLGMAPAAHAYDLMLEAFLVGAFDRVRGMAVSARGQFFF